VPGERKAVYGKRNFVGRLFFEEGVERLAGVIHASGGGGSLSLHGLLDRKADAGIGRVFWGDTLWNGLATLKAAARVEMRAHLAGMGEAQTLNPAAWVWGPIVVGSFRRNPDIRAAGISDQT
jgi:hypothetical protein